ncbi:phosphoglycerate kinase, chloroplastic, partial [Tanacetum coccineum]
SQWTRIALFIFMSHYDVDLSADVWSLRNIGCQIIPETASPDGWMGLDIGPNSVKTFNDALETTKTVICLSLTNLKLELRPVGSIKLDESGSQICDVNMWCKYIIDAETHHFDIV